MQEDLEEDLQQYYQLSTPLPSPPSKPDSTLRLTSQSMRKPLAPKLQQKPAAPSRADIDNAATVSGPGALSKPLPSKKAQVAKAPPQAPPASTRAPVPALEPRPSVASAPVPIAPPVAPAPVPVAQAPAPVLPKVEQPAKPAAPSKIKQQAAVPSQQQPPFKPQGATAPAPAAAAPITTSPKEEVEQQEQEQESSVASELSVPPPLTAPPPRPRPAKRPSAVSEAQREVRRKLNIQLAEQAIKDKAILDVTIWSCNSAGVLVRTGALSGFVPLSELGSSHIQAVRDAEEVLIQRGAPPHEAPTRRSALETLIGTTLNVTVLQADEASGRVIMSERAAVRAAAPLPPAAPSREVLAAAALRVGQVVQATVMNVKAFGVFVQFNVQTEAGEESAVGLVHVSELSWDPLAVAKAGADFKVRKLGCYLVLLG